MFDTRAPTHPRGKHTPSHLPPAPHPQLLWPGLFARHGARLPYGFDISTVAHLSEGFSSGALDAVVSSLLSRQRLARLRDGSGGAGSGSGGGGGGGEGARGEAGVTVEEILQWLSRVRWRLGSASKASCFVAGLGVASREGRGASPLYLQDTKLQGTEIYAQTSPPSPQRISSTFPPPLPPPAPQVKPVSREQDEALRGWAGKTPALAAIRGAAAAAGKPGAAGGGGAKKGGKAGEKKGKKGAK